MNIPSGMPSTSLGDVVPVPFTPQCNSPKDQSSQLLQAFQKFERNIGFMSDVKNDEAFPLQSTLRDQLKHAFYQLEENFSVFASKFGGDESESKMKSGLDTDFHSDQGAFVLGNSNMTLDSDVDGNASAGSQDALSSLELQHLKVLLKEINGFHIRDENLKHKVTIFRRCAESILSKVGSESVDQEPYLDRNKTEKNVVSASVFTGKRKTNTKNTASILASWRNYLMGHKEPLNIKPLGMTTTVKSPGSNFSSKADF